VSGTSGQTTPKKQQAGHLGDEFSLYVNLGAGPVVETWSLNVDQGTIMSFRHLVYSVQYCEADSNSHRGSGRAVAHVYRDQLPGPTFGSVSCRNRIGAEMRIDVVGDHNIVPRVCPAVRVTRNTNSSPAFTSALLAVLTGGMLCCRGCVWAGFAQALELREARAASTNPVAPKARSPRPCRSVFEWSSLHQPSSGLTSLLRGFTP
jgi:hypothetical protein